MVEYLTYEQYEEYGGTLDEEVFAQLAFEAKAQIDWRTFNRLHNETEIPEAVKRCMYYLIQLLSTQLSYVVPALESSNDSTGGAQITSQSNDGVSISYNVLSASEAVEQCKTQIADTINRYLNGITNTLGRKLLYRGIYPDE